MVGKIKFKDSTDPVFGDENSERSYKEVVVIGNGPSGIILSYFLAGNWPYYNGLGEDLNEMLHYRLIASGGGVNNNSEPTAIVEQDLNFLSQVSQVCIYYTFNEMDEYVKLSTLLCC